MLIAVLFILGSVWVSHSVVTHMSTIHPASRRRGLQTTLLQHPLPRRFRFRQRLSTSVLQSATTQPVNLVIHHPRGELYGVND
jgi:acetyl esterase/lipase